MCLAVPARILSLEGDEAMVDIGGARARVSVALIDTPRVGGWVVIHTGYALSVLDDEAALALADQIEAILAEETPA